MGESARVVLAAQGPRLNGYGAVVGWVGAVVDLVAASLAWAMIRSFIFASMAVLASAVVAYLPALISAANSSANFRIIWNIGCACFICAKFGILAASIFQSLSIFLSWIFSFDTGDVTVAVSPSMASM